MVNVPAGIGISPDAILCRTEYPLTPEIKQKIALFCDVKPNAVVQCRDAQSIYQVPLNLEAEGLADAVCQKFGMQDRVLEIEDWRSMVRRIQRPKGAVRVALHRGLKTLADDPSVRALATTVTAPTASAAALRSLALPGDPALTTLEEVDK